MIVLPRKRMTALGGTQHKAAQAEEKSRGLSRLYSSSHLTAQLHPLAMGISFYDVGDKNECGRQRETTNPTPAL